VGAPALGMVQLAMTHHRFMVFGWLKQRIAGAMLGKVQTELTIHQLINL
jgi:hypothetical protein